MIVIFSCFSYIYPSKIYLSSTKQVYVLRRTIFSFETYDFLSYSLHVRTTVLCNILYSNIDVTSSGFLYCTTSLDTNNHKFIINTYVYLIVRKTRRKRKWRRWCTVQNRYRVLLKLGGAHVTTLVLKS